jgi:flagellar biosynthesis/type III secretory pathway ATPase
MIKQMLVPTGRGPAYGVFAPAGAGKSTLLGTLGALGMPACGTASDVNVIVLIGERALEVREFIEMVPGPAGMVRSRRVHNTQRQRLAEAMAACALPPPVPAKLIHRSLYGHPFAAFAFFRGVPHAENRQ